VEKPMPFVSVIVPVYNAVDMVGDCIESLLNQDYPKDRYEIIIVDNDSTDGTAEVIRRYPVQYLLEAATHTSYAARNTGVQKARGELLAFCDADETAGPAWIRSLVAALGEGYGGSAGPMLPAPHEKTLFMAYAASDANPYHFDAPTDIQVAVTGNVMFRRSVFDQLGGFGLQASGADLTFSRRVISELGLKVRFTPDAFVYHKPRTTLMKLLRREARAGYGGESSHRDQPRPVLPMLWQAMVRLLKNAAVAAATLLFVWHAWFRKKCFWAIMNILMVFANLYGKFRYRFGGQVPRDW
jgi:glycosyltransferase involved in cell wall biosynthesis